eukprot:552932_1
MSSLWMARWFISNPWNVYTKETECEITDYQYQRNWSCDMDDGDRGILDHVISFHQNCNKRIYDIEYECHGVWWGYSYKQGDIHQCWTNESCSIQALFDDDVGLFFLRWGLLFVGSALLFILLAFIGVVMDSSRMSKFPKRLDSDYFMYGYFRSIQQEPECCHIVVPLDIMLLCRSFYVNVNTK